MAPLEEEGVQAGMKGSNKWETVLYAGTFRRNLVADQVDEVVFKSPVRVTHVRVVPLYVADSKLPDFSGFTSPGSFQLDVFGGQWNQPQVSRLSKLCPTLMYEAPGVDSFCAHTEPCLLDRLIIRGRYRTLSVIVMGVPGDAAVVENCSVMWDKKYQGNRQQAAETSAKSQEQGVRETCRYLDSLVPLKNLWNSNEDYMDGKIQSALSNFDLNATDNESQFNKFKKEVLFFLSSEFWAGHHQASMQVDTAATGAVVDKVVGCLDKGDGKAPYQQLRVSAVASALLCFSPRLVVKFAKRGGMDALWNLAQSETADLEMKFWSMLAFVAASCHVEGLHCLAGHAHTVKGSGDGFQNLEEGLLGLAMQASYIDVAPLATKVVQHLQVYNASVSLATLASDLGETSKAVDSKRIDSILECIINVQDVFSKLAASEKLDSSVANSSVQIRSDSYLDQTVVALPPAGAIAVQSLLKNKGVASLRQILSTVGTVGSAEAAMEPKIAVLINAIVEIFQLCDATKHGHLLAVKDTRNCELLCDVLEEVRKHRSSANLSNLNLKLKQSLLAFTALDTLAMQIQHQCKDERAVLEAIQKLASCGSELYESGGLCDALLDYVLDLFTGTGEGGLEIEVTDTGDMKIHFGVVYVDLVYTLLAMSNEVDHSKTFVFMEKMDKILSSQPDREGFNVSPLKIESLLEVKRVLDTVKQTGPISALQACMKELSAKFSATKVYGMAVAMKVLTKYMKETPIGTQEYTSINIPDFIEEVRKTLVYLHEQHFILGQQQKECWKGLMSHDPCLFFSWMNLIQVFDAAIYGIEACLQVLLSYDVEMVLPEFSKAFVRSYDLLFTFCGALEGGRDSGVVNRLVLSYTACLRMWTLSKCEPSVLSEILGDSSEGSISFSVAKYLEPVDMLRAIKLMNLLIPFVNSEEFLPLKRTIYEQTKGCTAGILSILSQAVFFSSVDVKRPLVEFCFKVSHLGAEAARAVVGPVLELLQQEYEIIDEDKSEISCAENLCDIIRILSTDALCKNVMIESGAITLMLSIFKEPLLSNAGVSESNLPTKVIQTISNLCNTDICLDERNPLYVRAVEDSPTVEEGTNFVSTLLDSMRSLSEAVMETVIDIFVKLSGHIPGRVALRSGASQWKTNAYWTGGPQEGDTVNAASALASAARFLRSTASGMEGEKKKNYLNSGAEILEGQCEGDDIDDDEEEEPPQPTDLESRFKQAFQLHKEFLDLKYGLRLQDLLDKIGSSGEASSAVENAVPKETEVQAQNRWHEDELRRKGSVFTQIKEMSVIPPLFGGTLTSTTGPTAVPNPGGQEVNGGHPMDMDGTDAFGYLNNGDMDTNQQMTTGGMEDDLDLYADIAPASVKGESAPNKSGDDLYGDIEMNDPVPETKPTAAGAGEAGPESFSADNLTPETIAQLLKDPEALQPLLEKHPQLLQFLQQSLNV
jgi:hypothetical protein